MKGKDWFSIAIPFAAGLLLAAAGWLIMDVKTAPVCAGDKPAARLGRHILLFGSGGRPALGTGIRAISAMAGAGRADRFGP